MKEKAYKASVYFNFPIQMVEGLINSKEKFLNDIFDYAVYAHSMKLVHGTGLKKIEAALNYFGVTSRSNEITLSNGKLLYGKFLRYKSPLVGIHKEMYFDFYKNEKTDFEIATLTAFLALKSIMGDKPYMRISNLFMLSRMDGKLKSVKNIKELSLSIRKYATEYYTKKLRNELHDNWGLVYVQSRGVYVSFTLTQFELKTATLKESVKSKDRFRSKQMKEANEEAKKQFNAKQK